MMLRLGQIAYARSGDKGASANIGLIARTPFHYALIKKYVTPQSVQQFFSSTPVTRVARYELPNLNALNFVLHDILDGGGSLSLQIDAQGKALGQQLLEMTLDIPDDLLKEVSCG